MVSVDKNHSLLKLLLIDKQVPNICKYFANNLPVDVTLLKKESKLSSQMNFLNILNSNSKSV